jgi:hypothetical protein
VVSLRQRRVNLPIDKFPLMGKETVTEAIDVLIPNGLARPKCFDLMHPAWKSLKQLRP